MVSLQQWAVTWGILIQYFIQYGASFTGGGPDNIHQGTSAFRIPWAVQIVPAAVLFMGMFFLPYTPRWLAAQDRWEEAIRVLANLHGHGDIGHPNVLAQYREIEEMLRFEREASLNTMRALTQPRMLNRVVLGMSIQMWSQLVGMNMMVSNISKHFTAWRELTIFKIDVLHSVSSLLPFPHPPPTIPHLTPHPHSYLMQSAGIGDPLLTASIQYILNVALTVPALLFLDTWGRRPSLLFGALGQGICLFLVGGLEAYYGMPNPHTDPNTAAISWVLLDHPSVSRAVIALSYLFVSIFAITWGPTSWVYASEIFPSGIRAKAVSLSTASNWMWNTAIGFAVPPLLWSINWKMYMIFGAFNMLAFVHVFFAAPETKGKTLEEMDDVFDVRRPAWERRQSGSRLDELQREIEAGEVKVVAPVVTEVAADR